MPEVKNIFVGAKMNKDLNPRMISNQEYIDARNAAIINSEGSDSGLLQNVSGNVLLTDFGLTGVNLEIIGFYIDSTNNRIFAFITDWNDTSSDGLSNYAPSTSSHYICLYDLNSAQGTVLVSGSFLNFAKNKRIFGINLLEDLLFFTDDRNQPRKINVKTAIENANARAGGSTYVYYSKEEDISVSRYYPWKSISFLKNEINPSFVPYSLQGNSSLEISGVFPLYKEEGGQDFKNGFVEIVNYTSSSSGSGAILVVFFTNGFVVDVIVKPSTSINGVSFTEGSTITISANDFPTVIGTTWFLGSPIVLNVLSENIKKESTLKDVTSKNLPGAVTVEVIGPITTTSFRVAPPGISDKWLGATISAVQPSTPPTPPQERFNALSGITITGIAEATATGQTVLHTEISNIQEGDIVTLGANPYYSNTFNGDSNFLSDKFIRFSYRFKYDNNEYSLSAPFSQIAFIPNQDGYFLEDSVPSNINDDDANSDENNAVKSTIISFFENKINQAELIIPLPEDIPNGKSLVDILKVQEIDILYKESDKTSIQVLDTISNSDLRLEDSDTISYKYSSQSPVKTLPTNDSTRASDKTPIRAKAQEVTGNRVIYGNYLVRTARPNSIDYVATTSEKNELGNFNSLSELEYPNSVLKQNRSYKVGIVLADKFGRQSDVITSENSTVYCEYRNTPGDFITDSETEKSIYRGSSLKVDFISKIPELLDVPGYAGLYSETNPLGWYTYKVVVQQKEQDYYNVFLPTILNYYPQKNTNASADPKIPAPTKSQSTAFITLFSDNINKVPRDLKEVGAQDLQFSSSVNLFGRVYNTSFISTTPTSRQFVPNTTPDKVTLIGTRNEIGLDKMVDGEPYTVSPFYSIPSPSGGPVLSNQTGANPYIGEVSTQKLIGATGGGIVGDSLTNNSQVSFNLTRLNVYETAPIESNLDIFYETGTSGLISELNQSIETVVTDLIPASIDGWSFNLTESTAPNTIISLNSFDILTYQGLSLSQKALDSTITLTGEIVDVFNGVNESVVDNKLFVLKQNLNKKFQIETGPNANFAYKTNSYQVDNWKFVFEFTTTDIATGLVTSQRIIQDYGSSRLQNVFPQLISPTTSLNEFSYDWTYFTPDGGDRYWKSPRDQKEIRLSLPIFTEQKYISANSSGPYPFETIGVFDFRNGALSNLLNKDGLSYVIENVLYWDEWIGNSQNSAPPQYSKWVDITNYYYKQKITDTSYPTRGELETIKSGNSTFRLQIDSNKNLEIQAVREHLRYWGLPTIPPDPLGLSRDTVYKLVLKVRDSTNYSNGYYGIGNEGWNKISVYVRVYGATNT